MLAPAVTALGPVRAGRTRRLRRTIATVAVGALIAGSVTLLGATPASAKTKEREFRVANAEVDFEVEKDDGRFEIDVDIDARRGERYRVVLWQNGNRYHKKVHRTDRDGDIEIEKNRRDTQGRDTFKIKVKKVGGPKAETRTIRFR